MKIAISGFRHGHIGSIVKEMAHYPQQLQIVAACERDPQKAEPIIKASGATITHKDLDTMLREVECDAVAVGDVYADRGAQVIKALEAGKHVLADKPMCSSPAEMRRIRQLAEEKDRKVIVALTLRYVAAWQTARRIVREGAIGEVCTATVHGQHPLNYKAGRPEWYFEQGRHGGTINDIMVHGIDSMLYVTGLPVVEVVAARAWHMQPAEVPFFQDCAQAFLRLSNGAGVMMESSYKAVKGHATPWTMTIWGTDGDMTFTSSGAVTVRRPGEPAKAVEAKIENKGNIVEDFIQEVEGFPGRQQQLTTAESLDASEKAVLAQEAADKAKAFVKV